MSVAREGVPFILVAVVLAVASDALALNRRSWPLWLLASVVTLVALWVVYFFRDPERPGPRGDALVIAPADGRIVHVTEIDEPAYLGGRALRISIFMNVFNVHVNRYPVSGTVEFRHYNPGKFLNAANEKSSLENEQMSVGIAHGATRVMMRQIAGLIARRIVTYSKVGDTARQGERMGLIRFGSRVDVFLPTSASVRVRVGQSSQAGITVLAELPAS